MFLIIETNYHRPLLWDSDYPQNVKCRIDTPTGHLANQEAGSLLEWLAGEDRGSRLKLVLGCHLGGQSNTPQLAEAALRDGWGRGGHRSTPRIDILPRLTPSPIYKIDIANVRSYDHAETLRLFKQTKGNPQNNSKGLAGLGAQT